MQAVDAFEVKANPEQGIEGHPAKQLIDLLGEALTVNLIQYTKKGGDNAGQLANKISSFTPMKGKDKKTAKALVNPTVYFDLGDPDLAVYEKLPGGDKPYAIKNRVRNNLEFEGSKLQALLGIAPTPAAGATPNQASAEQVDEAMKAELAAQEAARAAAASQNAEGQGAMPF